MGPWRSYFTQALALALTSALVLTLALPLILALTLTLVKSYYLTLTLALITTNRSPHTKTVQGLNPEERKKLS